MKNRLIEAVLLIMLVLCMTACTDVGSENYEEHSALVPIENRQNLYYDTCTKVVYFIFNECCGHRGYGYMSAYYAPNGFPYLYDPARQELVEISPEDQAE